MFLDSGNIISDETLCTQSNYGEKVPEFLAELLCLRQGMATSGRWCHMTHLDHVTPVGGCQLGCPGRTEQGHRPGHPSCHPPTHMIQKGHVIPTATSCHPLTKAERFCWKFGNCVQNVSSEKTDNLRYTIASLPLAIFSPFSDILPQRSTPSVFSPHTFMSWRHWLMLSQLSTTYTWLPLPRMTRLLSFIGSSLVCKQMWYVVMLPAGNLESDKSYTSDVPWNPFSTWCLLAEVLVVWKHGTILSKRYTANKSLQFGI